MEMQPLLLSNPPWPRRHPSCSSSAVCVAGKPSAAARAKSFRTAARRPSPMPMPSAQRLDAFSPPLKSPTHGDWCRTLYVKVKVNQIIPASKRTTRFSQSGKMDSINNISVDILHNISYFIMSNERKVRIFFFSVQLGRNHFQRNCIKMLCSSVLWSAISSYKVAV